MKKIAWIGTGVMGKPMALHVAKAGYEVHAYNRTYEKAQALEPHITAHKTIESAVKDADVIVTIVGYPQDVEAVFNTVMDHASPGAVLIDMTTSSPSLAHKLYLQGKEHGFQVLDAPVTGGDIGAQNATLSIMVGGEEAVFKAVYPLFDILGQAINYMGPAGHGQHAKLANQTAIAGAIAGTAEALTYAAAKGLDLETMLNVIVKGSASSWQAANNGPKMIVKDYQPGFFIKHFLKDLKLVLAEKDGLELPILQNVVTIYETLNQNGYSEAGSQAILEYYLNALK